MNLQQWSTQRVQTNPFEMEDLIMTYEDKDGSVRLLPGYKFDPTDEVLVYFYLKKKAFAQPLPFQIIPVFDVFQCEPWGLPGGDGKIFNERKCFFYNTMGRDLENLDIRVAGSGEWRVIEKSKDVHIPRNNKVIGKRNTLNFWEVQGACTRRTKWVMHEFRLTLIANPSKMANWVVYRIFQNKNAKKVKNARWSDGESSNSGRNARIATTIDFNVESDSSSSSPLMAHSLSEGNEYP
ncbi:NAC domain-containing protein 83-like [Lotus japonicus]|uniref:NAC domain-containing protein 83-like n=1 Tax=Lotus japonicus TaxID=34305 RepID=UPI00258D4808|nr:NAC domain-containing protein 83-like [Lotus japonicus]